MTSNGMAAPRRSDATRAAILAAARTRFAADGYQRATIRAIAACAGIDPSMVIRYFGSKEQLFAAATDFDLRLPDLSRLPPEQLPAALVRLFLDRWEGDPSGDGLLLLLRSAVTNEQAGRQLTEILGRQVTPVLAAAIGAERAARCGGLVSAQLLGLALCRHLLPLPGLAELTHEALVERYAPALRAVLFPEAERSEPA